MTATPSLRSVVSRWTQASAALVARLRDAVGGGGGAVVGLVDTVGAIIARRVGTLLVSEDYETPGWRCPVLCVLRGATRRSSQRDSRLRGHQAVLVSQAQKTRSARSVS